jgi:hypothetical protein
LIWCVEVAVKKSEDGRMQKGSENSVAAGRVRMPKEASARDKAKAIAILMQKLCTFPEEKLSGKGN